MARPRTMKRLNDAKSEVIAENVLKENPEGFESTENINPDNIVIAKFVPAYRKIVFLNGRDPGIALMFHYSSKTHPLKNYTLYHGMEHSLPEEVIDHLEQCAEPVYAYKKGIDGHPQMYVESRKFIFQCRNVRKTG